LAAALLNSSFIQAFELDDYHAESPIHSSSVILPALFALRQHHAAITDSQFLLAAVVGYELGPRIGLGLWGGDILTRGWHSGAVFGPAAAAAAVSKAIGLNARQTEEAIGIACTQACGLMSAQYGSMVKRMQHGFAARNGLFSALMVSNGYTGIRSVLETPYGGFISTFGNGGTRDPPTTPDRIIEDLGRRWELQKINVKPYASMAGTHGTIDCVRMVQEQYPDALKDISAIEEIVVEMSEPAFKKGGWTPTRPVESTAAQMSAAFAAACQIVDRNVLVEQFAQASLNRDEIWRWVGKFRIEQNLEYNKDKQTMWFQQMTIVFRDPTKDKVIVFVPAPRGVKPLLTNEEIVCKWRSLMQTVLEDSRRSQIEECALHLGEGTRLSELVELLGAQTKPLTGF
jgi:aconitate decarboxylase